MNRRVQVRMSEEQYQLAENIADKLDISIAALFRKALFKWDRPLINQKQGDMIYHAFNRIGNNINQISKSLNSFNISDKKIDEAIQNFWNAKKKVDEWLS